MTIIFDGKKFAAKKEKNLRKKVSYLRKKGIIPKLASILVGDDPASRLYVNLKKKAAERIGADLEVVRVNAGVKSGEIIKLIKKSNSDKTVHGIMLQLPLPEELRLQTKDIIQAIDPKKDVDGLREDSAFVHPTVKTVLEIMSIGEKSLGYRRYPHLVAFVGITGFVGRHFKSAANRLNPKIFKIVGLNSRSENFKDVVMRADILISATGVSGLIKESMVKKGVVLIDVGSPNGDIERSVYEKASFVSPVPGGVGPVTISCLMENLIRAAKNKSFAF